MQIKLYIEAGAQFSFIKNKQKKILEGLCKLCICGNGLSHAPVKWD